MLQQSIRLAASATAAESPPWHSTLFIPAYLSIASIFLVAFQLLLQLRPFTSLLAHNQEEVQEDLSIRSESEHDIGIRAKIREHMRHLGGLIIYLFNLLRFLACLAFLALTVALLIHDIHTTSSSLFIDAFTKWDKKKHHRLSVQEDTNTSFSSAEWQQVSLGAVFVSYCLPLHSNLPFIFSLLALCFSPLFNDPLCSYQVGKTCLDAPWFHPLRDIRCIFLS